MTKAQLYVAKSFEAAAIQYCPDLPDGKCNCKRVAQFLSLFNIEPNYDPEVCIPGNHADLVWHFDLDGKCREIPPSSWVVRILNPDFLTVLTDENFKLMYNPVKESL